MNASDVMTRKVVSVRLDAPIGDAIRQMLDHGISGLPVADGDSNVVAMLTEGDLLRRAETRTKRQRSRVIINEKERYALRVVAENVPGVKVVRDHLVWVEPVSGTVIEPPVNELVVHT